MTGRFFFLRRALFHFGPNSPPPKNRLHVDGCQWVVPSRSSERPGSFRNQKCVSNKDLHLTKMSPGPLPWVAVRISLGFPPPMVEIVLAVQTVDTDPCHY